VRRLSWYARAKPYDRPHDPFQHIVAHGGPVASLDLLVPASHVFAWVSSLRSRRFSCGERNQDDGQRGRRKDGVGRGHVARILLDRILCIVRRLDRSAVTQEAICRWSDSACRGGRGLGSAALVRLGRRRPRPRCADLARPHPVHREVADLQLRGCLRPSPWRTLSRTAVQSRVLICSFPHLTYSHG
jgi:hypothetical protein